MSEAAAGLNGQSKKPKRYLLISILFLGTVNLAVFLPSMRGDFLWDDKYFISENPNIQAPHFLRNFLSSPFGGFSGLDENSARMDRVMQFYRPLTSLSYWLDFKVWGLNPAAFHLTNILLHVANAVLFLLVLLALGLSPLASFLAGLLFSVFPLHFENVAWISGRTDLLSFFFAALSVLFLIGFLHKKNGLKLILSSFLFLGSLLAKESAMILPILFLILLVKREIGPKKTILCILSYAAALGIWFILRTIASGSTGLGYSGRSAFDFFAALGFYTAKLLAPFNLSVSVDAVPVFRNVPYRFLGALLGLLFFLCLFQVLHKKWAEGRPYLAVVSYFLLLLPPLAAIFSAGTISLLAWRFLYLPSAVLLAGLAWAAFRFLKPRAVPAAVLFLVVLFYGVEIYPKNTLYGNEEAAFWQGFRDIEREDVLARFNIGIKGLARDEEKSLAVLNGILEDRKHPLFPMFQVRIYEELAAHYTSTGRFGQAERYFNELFKIQSSHSLHFYFNYAFFLALTGKIQEGEKYLADILGRFPQNHYVLTQAAKFYLIIKDYAKAAEFYLKDYSLFRHRQSLLLLQELEAYLKK